VDNLTLNRKTNEYYLCIKLLQMNNQKTQGTKQDEKMQHTPMMQQCITYEI